MTNSFEPTRNAEEMRSINWAEIYARLEEAHEALEAEQFRPEEAGRILRERAQALARPRTEIGSPAEEVELLVFSVAKERYGIDPLCVLDVAPSRRLTGIPGTPAFVLGVMNYMARLRPVLDLRRILDPGGPGSDGKWVVTMEAGGMMFGILCEAVIGMIRIRAETITPAPAALGSGQRGYIRGVTEEMVTVLDLEALTRDPRIVVHDEVG